MRITDPDQLYAGKIIYRVHAFTEQRKLDWTSIEKCEVVQVPVTVGSNPNFILLQYHIEYTKVDFIKYTWVYRTFSHHRSAQEHSMQDMGIISNCYNSHRTFDNIDDAKEYICTVLQTRIMEPKDKAVRNNYDRAMKVLDLD